MCNRLKSCERAAYKRLSTVGLLPKALYHWFMPMNEIYPKLCAGDTDNFWFLGTYIWVLRLIVDLVSRVWGSWFIRTVAALKDA